MAGSTSSTSVPANSFGWTKAIRRPPPTDAWCLVDQSYALVGRGERALLRCRPRQTQRDADPRRGRQEPPDGRVLGGAAGEAGGTTHRRGASLPRLLAPRRPPDGTARPRIGRQNGRWPRRGRGRQWPRGRGCTGAHEDYRTEVLAARSWVSGGDDLGRCGAAGPHRPMRRKPHAHLASMLPPPNRA